MPLVLRFRERTLPFTRGGRDAHCLGKRTRVNARRPLARPRMAEAGGSIAPLNRPIAMASSMRSLFETAIPRWDERVESWETVAAAPAFARLADRVLRDADPDAGDRVVDFGAGTGLLALAFAPLVTSVVAIDNSGGMLERLAENARAAALTNVETLVCDMRSVPLPDGSATLIVSNYAFHHLDDAGKQLALSEARRLLVPGGRLVICDMMFALSLQARDRQIVLRNLTTIARRGPSGVMRIARNAARIATGTWEKPSPRRDWERFLSDRHFAEINVVELEHEGGLALARRPGAMRG